MVSHDLFLSSPKRVQKKHDSLAIGSSSPDLPPLHDILSQRYRKSPLKAGSRCAPIPLDAETGFQSASSLYAAANSRISSKEAAEASPNDEETAAVTLNGLTQPLNNCKQKPATTSRREETLVPEVVKDDLHESPMSPSKVQPWRKFIGRNKTSEGDHLKEVDAETVASADTGSISKAAKNIEETSRHFMKPSASLKPPKAKDNVEERVMLDLEPAMARRTDWTPPKPCTSMSLKFDAALDSPGTAPDTDTQNGFANLLADYKFTEVEVLKKQSDVVCISDEDSSFLKKRKRIDLVDTSKRAGTSSTSSREISPTKKKASKRKTRTLTDLATEAYKIPDSEEPISVPESMLDSFLASAESGATPVDITSRGKGKGKSKRAAKPSKKKAAPPPPALLSPTAALRQAAQQDILFGTSSQLAHEKSPTFLKELQKAMKLSIEMKSDPFDTTINSDGIEGPQHRTLKLWEAAARDEDGLLFDIEMVDLANGSLPLPLSDHADEDPFGYKHPDLVSPTERSKAQEFEFADDSVVELPGVPAITPALPEREDVAGGNSSEPAQAVNLVECFSDSEISVSSNLHELHNQKKKAVQRVTQDSNGPPAITATEPLPETSSHSSALQRPNFEFYTDARLSSELRRFGFKPVKRRTVMISLLDQCWQSQQGSAGSGLGQVASFSTSAVTARPPPRTESSTTTKAKTAPAVSRATQKDAPPAKRPRGRPRKNSVAEADSQVPPPSAQPPETPKRGRGRPTKDGSPSKPQPGVQSSKAQGESPRKKKAASKKDGGLKSTKPAASNVIEIPDSASELDSEATLPRSVSPEPTFSSPEGVDLSLSLAEDTELSLSMSPDQEQTALFSSITQAVKSAPRTTDPKNPSWHEKMLMYDPIVIEDLTSWLNAGQLTKVGHDAEVRPAIVKKWCESKSVCCLWKVNLRGKERKRY